jgi:hypothetical protein
MTSVESRRCGLYRPSLESKNAHRAVLRSTNVWRVKRSVSMVAN